MGYQADAEVGPVCSQSIFQCESDWCLGGRLCVDFGGAASGVAGVLTYQAQTERSHRPQALNPRYSDVIGFIDGQVPLWLYFDPEGVKEHSSAQAHRIAHLPLVIARQMQPRTFSQLLDEGVFSQHLHEMVLS